MHGNSMDKAIPLKERTLEEYAKEQGKTVEEVLKDTPIKIIETDINICPKQVGQQT